MNINKQGKSGQKGEISMSIDERKMRNGAINFGFVGVGQCGNKLVDIGARRNYPTMAINTTDKDLIGLAHVTKSNRYLASFPGALGGAGKDPEVGRQAAEEHKDRIIAKSSDVFSDCRFIWFAVGFGGGTGTGTIPVLLESFAEAFPDKNFGVIATIPHDNEGMEVKSNALAGMQETFNIAVNYDIPIVLVDNNRIFQSMQREQKDWRHYNNEVVSRLLSFNGAVSKESPYTSFDEADYMKTLCIAGACSITECKIPVDKFFSSEQALVQAMEVEWDKNLVGVGDYKNSQIGAIIIEAPKHVLDNANSYSMIVSAINNLKDAGGIKCPYEGIYVLDAEHYKEEAPHIIVRTLLTGMPAPRERLQKIYEVAQEEQVVTEKRFEQTMASMDLSNMTLNNPLKRRSAQRGAAGRGGSNVATRTKASLNYDLD